MINYKVKCLVAEVEIWTNRCLKLQRGSHVLLTIGAADHEISADVIDQYLSWPYRMHSSTLC